jgi:type IV pilus assembly protein PilP
MSVGDRLARRPWLALGALVLLLGGCGSRDQSDLQAFVAEVQSRAGGRIEPLPVMKPSERYLYQSAEAARRDPFEDYYEVKRASPAERQVSDAQRRFLQEIQTHNPEELENFELDSLRMVGTLQNLGSLWGIVLDGDGTVHRVTTGSYMGRNYGKVIRIAEERIEVREIVSDGQGGWDERPASLALFTE